MEIDDTDISTVKELCIWLEGKFKLNTKAIDNLDSDMKGVRTRIHDLSNEMAKFSAMDLPAKFRTMELHNAELETLRTDAIKRQAAATAFKTAYALGGAFVGSVVTIALELYKVIHT